VSESAGLRAGLDERHTARRIWQRLGAEQGAVVSEVTVSRYVRRRRVELGLTDPVEVMVVQDHEPGAEGEADLGEFYAEIAPTLSATTPEPRRCTAPRAANVAGQSLAVARPRRVRFVHDIDHLRRRSWAPCNREWASQSAIAWEGKDHAGAVHHQCRRHRGGPTGE
jgi:hypothetical protein